MFAYNRDPDRKERLLSVKMSDVFNKAFVNVFTGRFIMMLSGLELIKSYRMNPGYYLPILDHTEEVPGRNEYGEFNIGWNAGLLEENRPFFAECWAADQMTMLTINVSAKGIEEKTRDEIDRCFQDVGYYSYRGERQYPANVEKVEYPDGEEYFIVNLLLGTEDEPSLVNGARVLPWSLLNEYNRETSGKQS